MKPLALILMLGCSAASLGQSLTGYVDPFIGTGFTGHTYPAATTPFGMVQAGPDNGNGEWKFCSGYHTDSKSIAGFSHTHLSGTGAAEMGDVMIMPVIAGQTETAERLLADCRSDFRNETEEAHPGYYRVELDRYGIIAEMTATPRCAIHRYSLKRNAGQTAAKPISLIIDLGHGIGDHATETYMRQTDPQTIVGMRRSSAFVKDHRYYFTLRLSRPIAGEVKPVAGTDTKLLLTLGGNAAEPLLVKVGLSTASEAGAKLNLDAEIPGWNFDAVRQQADQTWEQWLGRISVKSADEAKLVSFYTSLYHSLLMPNLVSDADGMYRGWDGLVHHSEAGAMYTNFSLWDTYRAEHPFLAFVYPEVNSLMVRSMLERYRQTGMLPTNEYGMCETWCMIGNHAVPVIADAMLKGDRSFDQSLAYEAMHTAMTKEHNKAEWGIYNRYGYFPYDSTSVESVSRTMETCYDDYCLALVAKALGKTAESEFFARRSENYKNVYDRSRMVVRGRSAAGRWREPFNPLALTSEAEGGDFTEGNANQWTWHVQHDVDGLISIFGSKQEFVKHLNILFDTKIDDLPGHEAVPDVTGLIGLYSHGNEPSHHISYLYTLAGKPRRTAELVRYVFDHFYLPGRDGLCGNDDCGQMSAWYMFSAMGFYPVDPVSGRYVFGAPQMEEIKVQLPNGKQLTVKARNLSAKRKYVKSVSLNGRRLPLTTVAYNDLMQGGVLEYQMQ